MTSYAALIADLPKRSRFEDAYEDTGEAVSLLTNTDIKLISVTFESEPVPTLRSMLLKRGIDIYIGFNKQQKAAVMANGGKMALLLIA